MGWGVTPRWCRGWRRAWSRPWCERPAEVLSVVRGKSYLGDLEMVDHCNPKRVGLDPRTAFGHTASRDGEAQHRGCFGLLFSRWEKQFPKFPRESFGWVKNAKSLHCSPLQVGEKIVRAVPGPGPKRQIRQLTRTPHLLFQLDLPRSRNVSSGRTITVGAESKLAARKHGVFEIIYFVSTASTCIIKKWNQNVKCL